MLNIYIGNTNSKICHFNDAYFNSYYTQYSFDKTDKDIIHKIDGVEYKGKYRISSKFFPNDIIKVTELSTGTKTVLNVVNNQDKIFNIGECGKNAVEEIFKQNKGNIFIPYFIRPPRDLNNTVMVHYRGSKKEMNFRELENFLNEVFV